jgi:hypothetical protein
MQEHLDDVINVLTKHEWQPDGVTFSGAYRTGFNGYGQEIHYGGKARFKSPDNLWKVSVGKKITFFYRPNKGPLPISRGGGGVGIDLNTFDNWSKASFNTKDSSKIKAFLNSLPKIEKFIESIIGMQVIAHRPSSPTSGITTEGILTAYDITQQKFYVLGKTKLINNGDESDFNTPGYYYSWKNIEFKEKK